MSNAVIGVLIQRHVESGDLEPGKPLYDFGFVVLPYISYSSLGLALPDLCSLLSASLIAIGISLSFIPTRAVIILRRVLLICATAYAGRAISVPMTLLPNPDPDCHPLIPFESPLASALLVPFGGTITCADVFYSGHTIPITCSIFVWCDYLRYSRLRHLGLAVSCLALIGIIATHFHYTVDVFFGFVVTAALWRAYHFALSCPCVFHHFSFFAFWESDGAYHNVPRDSAPSGVVKMDFSKDPRITWSLPKTKEGTSSKITRSQIVLLIIVGLTLSPSWIAVFHKSHN
jgi:hypothetical protein